MVVLLAFGFGIGLLTRYSHTDRAREIFTMGFEFYGQEEEGIDKSQSLYSSFAKMEVRHKEYERARVIYKVSCGLSWSLLSFPRFALPSVSSAHD